MNTVTPESIDDAFSALLNWVTDTWKVLAVNSDYVFDPTHIVLSDIDSGFRLGSAEITTRTITSGVFSGDNVTIPTAGGDTLGALWIYKDTGTESTSRLFLFLDTNADGSAIGGPTASTGIVVTWSTRGIYRFSAVVTGV